MSTCGCITLHADVKKITTTIVTALTHQIGITCRRIEVKEAKGWGTARLRAPAVPVANSIALQPGYGII
jgi:hypothetical protein